MVREHREKSDNFSHKEKSDNLSRILSDNIVFFFLNFGMPSTGQGQRMSHQDSSPSTRFFVPLVMPA
jgi:hypothetical protein